MQAGTKFEVQKILQKRQNDRGESEYLIFWKGWPDHQTWESAEVLKGGAQQILTAFNNKGNPMGPEKGKQKRKR